MSQPEKVKSLLRDMEARPTVSTGADAAFAERAVQGLRSGEWIQVEIVYGKRKKRYSKWMSAETPIKTTKNHRIIGRERAFLAAYFVRRGLTSCVRKFDGCQAKEGFSDILKADFDHLDGIRTNNRAGNFGPSCAPCNKRAQGVQWKEIRALASSGLEKEIPSRGLGLLTPTQKERADAAIRINLDIYDIYCDWLKDEIAERREITVKHAIAGGAKYMRRLKGHGSPQSARNFLDMETSEEGDYVIIEGMVRKRETQEP